MEKISKDLKPVYIKIKKYGFIIFIILIGVVYGLIITTSSQLVAVEPSQNQIDDGYNGVKRPKLDKTITEKISELEDRNIKFRAIIDEARQNPFME